MTPQQRATPSVPTTDLTLLGLVRHLAAVETGWLVGFGALPPERWPDVVRDRDEQFRVDPETVTQADVDAARATWRAAADAVAEVARRLPLDTVDTPWGRDDAFSLRWILLHLLEEYARHVGHADLLREAVDGATGASSPAVDARPPRAARDERTAGAQSEHQQAAGTTRASGTNPPHEPRRTSPVTDLAGRRTSASAAAAPAQRSLVVPESPDPPARLAPEGRGHDLTAVAVRSRP